MFKVKKLLFIKIKTLENDCILRGIINNQKLKMKNNEKENVKPLMTE